MKCPTCNQELPEGVTVCPQCNPPPKEEKPKKKRCKIVALVAMFAGLILIGTGTYMCLSGGGDTTVVPSVDTPLEVTESTTSVTSGTIVLEDMPVYPDVTVVDTFETEGGGVRVAYEPQLGVTPKEIFDYYEEELTKLGWQRVTRDVGDAQMEFLAEDGTFVRFWIYFEGMADGGEELPATYMLDFQPPGAEILPVPVQ